MHLLEVLVVDEKIILLQINRTMLLLLIVNLFSIILILSFHVYIDKNKQDFNFVVL